MRKITWLVLGYMVVCFNCVLSAQAASFDCAKAASKMEKLICSDEQLSKMDEDLLVAYSKSLQDSTSPEIIRKQQREWLADVRIRCNDVVCLQRAYTSRIAQLATDVSAAKNEQPEKNSNLNNWGAPAILGNFNDPQAYTFPKIYFDSKDNATALWGFFKQKGDQPAGFQAFVNHYHAHNSSWTTKKLFMDKQAEGAGSMDTVFDNNGNAIVVWKQDGIPPDRSRHNIWSARYDAASNNWSADKLIESEADWMRIATNPKGDTMMLWRSRNSEHKCIFFSRYDAAAKVWFKSTIMIEEEQEGMGSVHEMQFVLDANGNAMAIWSSYEDHKSSIMSSRYDVVSKIWSKPVKISEPDAIDPQIAMDGKGNAIAVWGRRPNTVFGYYSVWANHYDVAKGWGKQRLIDISTTASEEELEKQGKDEDLGYVYGNNFYPKIAMDQIGNAIVVWHREYKASTNPWARRYDAKRKTWQKQVLLDNAWGVNTDHPEIAMDRKGNAIIVWPRADRDEAEEGGYAMPSRLAYTRYDAANGWGKIGLIGQNAEHVMVEHPQIGMDSNGNAIAVWQQKSEGQSNIMASYFKVQ